MAVHTNRSELSKEVINEYLAVAEHCVTKEKPDGGIYGYPAVLLLFCVIDALSNYRKYPKHSFKVLNDPCFGLNLSKLQIDQLKRWYRHFLVHQGLIAPGTILTPETDGDAFEFVGKGNEPTKIRVGAFYRMVKTAWENFPTDQLALGDQPNPLTPVDFTTANPRTASGAYIQSSKVKR